MKIPRKALTLILVAGLLVWLAAPASAATTHIGAVEEVRAGTDPSTTASGGFTVQIAESTGTYAVPAGYGVITAWSHSTGTVPGVLAFKVYRPTGATHEFRVLGADAQVVTADTIHSYPGRIPVRAGDRIGLSADEVELAYESGDPADRVGFFEPDPGPGATDTTDGEPFPNFKLDVSARVETDFDHDGFGDDTQDYGVPRSSCTRLKGTQRLRCLETAAVGKCKRRFKGRRLARKRARCIRAAHREYARARALLGCHKLKGRRRLRCIRKVRRKYDRPRALAKCKKLKKGKRAGCVRRVRRRFP
jgi:hypothetical protein